MVSARNGILFLLSIVIEPHELQWFVDMPKINISDEIRWTALARSLVNVAWVSLQIILLPAAAFLGYIGSRRRIWLLGPAAGTLIVLPGIVYQNAFYMYHYLALTVLASGLVTLASVQWWERSGRVPWCMVTVPLLWVVSAGVMQRSPFAWRTTHTWVAAGLVLAAIGTALFLAIWQVRHRWQGSSRVGRASLAFGGMLIALTLAFTFGGWPRTPYGFNYLDLSRNAAIEGREFWIAEGEAIARVTKNAQVVYLAGANVVYFANQPTQCRYPVSMFLIRSSLVEDSRLTSFQESMACLRDLQAQFLIFQRVLMRPGAMASSVKKLAFEEFDCASPVAKTPTTVICQRR